MEVSSGATLCDGVQTLLSESSYLSFYLRKKNKEWKSNLQNKHYLVGILGLLPKRVKQP